MPKLNLRTALRIKRSSGEIRQLKGAGFAWPDAGAAPPGDSPAAWFTPAAPFQVTPNTAPDQYYAATLAWSHRFTAGQLDFPRTSNRMFVSNGGFVDLQGEDDSVGLNLLGQLVSWAYATLGMTFTVSNLVNPGVNHNYVMLWNVAGLPSGNEAELWQDEVMVGYANGTIADVALRNLTLLGEGANVTAGETQGFWWKAGTAVPAATVFAELFDGTNGMLDLADPTVGGVTPDNYQFGP